MTPGAAAARPTPGAWAWPAGTPPGWRRLVLGGLVLAAVLSTRWVRLNGSPSVPLGLYRLAAVREPLTRGTLVVLPGDVVCLWDEGVWIEGQWYGPIYEEAAHKPLPKLRGCLLVKPGDVFLASPKPRSLDARYFGPTPITGLTAKAMPVLPWRSPHDGYPARP